MLRNDLNIIIIKILFDYFDLYKLAKINDFSNLFMSILIQF